MGSEVITYNEVLKRELKAAVARSNSLMIRDGIYHDDRKRMIVYILDEVKSEYIKVMEE